MLRFLLILGIIFIFCVLNLILSLIFAPLKLIFSGIISVFNLFFTPIFNLLSYGLVFIGYLIGIYLIYCIFKAIFRK